MTKTGAMTGRILLISWCAATVLTACGDSILRDDYQGRGWLEPDREPYRVQRDSEGNPVLPEASE